jgi:hypothetical protein
VGVRDAPHNRQAQAGAAPIVVSLSVGVEDGRQGIRWDAHTRVLSLELELGAPSSIRMTTRPPRGVKRMALAPRLTTS